ncbi:MAG: hypothetical protein FJ395_00190 [Verrucomicrobia bacterium]|nr:hypothetical protein [Verrucomicrobiota bacterium]
MENAEPKATLAPVTACIAPSLRDRVRLAQGFYFLFFGGMASVVFVAEMTLATAPRSFSTPLCAGSLLAMLVGAWRLHCVKTLGMEWAQSVRCLLIATALLAYLFPFLWAWRQFPRNFYFCCHGLAFLGMLILTVMAMSVASAALARAAGRTGLTWQMVLSLVTALVIQLAPFTYLARLLAGGVMQGEDVMMKLQAFVAHVHLFWVILWLLPFTLSLSLVWTAKDIALEQLLDAKQ